MMYVRYYEVNKASCRVTGVIIIVIGITIAIILIIGIRRKGKEGKSSPPKPVVVRGV